MPIMANYLTYMLYYRSLNHLTNKPFLRALAKQSSSDVQLGIGVDCFTLFATTIVKMQSK